MTRQPRRLAIVSLGGPPECGPTCSHHEARTWLDGDPAGEYCRHPSVTRETDYLLAEPQPRVIDVCDERPSWCPLVTKQEEA